MSSADDKNNNAAAKKAALEGVLQKIERSYGRGSIVKLGDADNMRVDSISTGALTLGKLEVGNSSIIF
jgi:recombination protein RecA